MPNKRPDRLEAMLGDTPFLVGGRPTLADGVLIGVSRPAGSDACVGHVPLAEGIKRFGA